MASLCRLGSLGVVAVLLAVGCAAADEPSVGDASDEVVGGNAQVQPPTVYFFDTRSGGQCIGALLDERIAITTKSCAEEDVAVVRPGDKETYTEAKVTKVHVPTEADADIAIVELDTDMPGPYALITQAPLGAGYTIHSVLTNGATDTYKTASIEAIMVSETDTHGAIIGAGDTKICTTDIGAPVCSSVQDTCGLAGLIVAAPESGTAREVGDEAKGSDTAKTGSDATSPAAANECPAGAWKVAPLGRYAGFIREHAKRAFEPIEVKRKLLTYNVPFLKTKVAVEGLWGYESSGTVRSCKIETQRLSAVKAGVESKVTAKVTFAELAKHAGTWGRFGIAPKATPSAVRWLPAQALSSRRGDGYETVFEGLVSTEEDGEYVISFRTSANGGESWTQCDLDGSENGYSVEQSIPWTVGDASQAPETQPSSTPASPTSSSGLGDERGEPDEDDASDPDDDADDSTSDAPASSSPKKKTKKKAAAGGCSASPTTPSAAAGNLAIFGAVAFAGALARRRKNRA